MAAVIVTQTTTPTGTTVSGTFRIPFNFNASDDWTGSFTGTLSSLTAPSTLSGSLTVSALINTGTGRCNGTRNNQTATVTATQIVFNAPGVWDYYECTSNTEDTVITLTR